MTSVTGSLVTKADQVFLRRIKLCVVGGPDTGREKMLDVGTVIVGSDAESDFVLTDPHVSRQHVEVRLRDDGIEIRDLGSKNGVTYGQSKVKHAVLAAGATIELGKTRLRLEAVDEACDVPLWDGESYGPVLGRSAAMRRLFALLARVAPSDSTILLQGETGVGKDLVARALHEHSQRKHGPFVTYDCASASPELIAADLFGCRKGAFTGAERDRRGVFEAANAGTIFLNEIGELPGRLQPSLLSVLEDRQIRPVGDENTKEVDIRIIAATNRPLEIDVQAQRFRSDLYYRLAVVSLLVPPLRQRIEDIPLLVGHFLHLFGHDGLTPSSRDLDILMACPWPGNVRELRNTIERGLALSDQELILPKEILARGSRSPGVYSLPYKEARSAMIEEFERNYLINLLRENGGNISRAARKAGIDRNYIHRLIKKLGIEKGEYES